jgi:hypothetical protein
MDHFFYQLDSLADVLVGMVMSLIVFVGLPAAVIIGFIAKVTEYTSPSYKASGYPTYGYGASVTPPTGTPPPGTPR